MIYFDSPSFRLLRAILKLKNYTRIVLPKQVIDIKPFYKRDLLPLIFTPLPSISLQPNTNGKAG